MTQQKPTRIIIDTDPGVDDSMAILFAFCSPEVQIEGILSNLLVCCNGKKDDQSNGGIEEERRRPNGPHDEKLIVAGASAYPRGSLPALHPQR